MQGHVGNTDSQTEQSPKDRVISAASAEYDSQTVAAQAIRETLQQSGLASEPWTSDMNSLFTASIVPITNEFQYTRIDGFRCYRAGCLFSIHSNTSDEAGTSLDRVMDCINHEIAYRGVKIVLPQTSADNTYDRDIILLRVDPEDT